MPVFSLACLADTTCIVEIDLREHAIFTLRNLLHRNLENQAVVDAIKPVGRWDEYGVLQPVVNGESDQQLQDTTKN